MKMLNRAGGALVALMFMVMAGMAQANSQAAWEEASGVMDSATRDMLAVVEDETLKAPENMDRMMGEVEKVISPVVDFPYIAKRVMGKYYRRASDEEMARFSEVFKNTLLKTFAKAIVGFEFTGYEIQPPRGESPEPDKQVINVKVSSGNGNTYALDYYMLKQDDRWTLVNVLVDGVNLRLTFKNQFADLYQRQNSITGVIDSWESQVATEVANGVTGSDEG
ncbi:MlaC/ttg2D family ABC transporter substrate-binding protein [Marinobacterium lutimaris]|uniref:Phospholipid transport system substrate-binding protein n=1 Tax=Marinobacterium lutimaris TaxID=568106 RepID=A0A1H6AYG5_9GAMM|nr:ABC transporter substrate-binding protein [Marinobacterium lutimaris]SEG53659.1 phospholipid transport system substrate-binding protein [Marinobacterium lutimaris]